MAALPREPPRCRSCGKVKPDVKWDPGLQMSLCGECWANIPPPPPPRRPPGAGDARRPRW